MPDSVEIMICKNWGKCPYASIWHDCDAFVSEVKKDLDLIVAHLWSNLNSLDENSQKLADIDPWTNDALKEILERVSSIINDQREISESTINTLNDRIKDIQEENTRLKNKLKTDELTWLLNRNTIDETFYKLVQAWKKFSVAIIDIDWFKSINDKYWHPVWDKVLQFLANLLVENFNKEVVYRIWWEEFMIMIDLNDNLLKNKLDNILDILSHKILRLSDNTTFKISFSAWLKQYSWESNFHEIYELADKTLYNVKHSWKNRVDIVTN